ncbi:hypothetical protein V8G54_007335, partial [Vigna mungo]
MRWKEKKREPHLAAKEDLLGGATTHNRIVSFWKVYLEKNLGSKQPIKNKMVGPAGGRCVALVHFKNVLHLEAATLKCKMKCKMTLQNDVVQPPWDFSENCNLPQGPCTSIFFFYKKAPNAWNLAEERKGELPL